MSFFSLLETSAWQIVRQTKTGERNIITCLTFYLLLSIKFPLPRPIIFTFTLCRKCGAHFSCVLETLEISGGDLKVQSSRFAIETISMSLPVKNEIFSNPTEAMKARHDMRYVMSIILGSPTLLSCGAAVGDEKQIGWKLYANLFPKKKRVIKKETNWVFERIFTKLLQFFMPQIPFALVLPLFAAINFHECRSDGERCRSNSMLFSFRRNLSCARRRKALKSMIRLRL